jgi:hypothetical protein
MVESVPTEVHVIYETIAEAIGYLYLNKVVQVYLGETGGSTHYADFDIDQKIFMQGKVLWAKGNVIALECEVNTTSKTHKTTVLVNAWSVTSVMEKSENNSIDISMVMKGLRR